MKLFVLLSLLLAMSLNTLTNADNGQRRLSKKRSRKLLAAEAAPPPPLGQRSIVERTKQFEELKAVRERRKTLLLGEVDSLREKQPTLSKSNEKWADALDEIADKCVSQTEPVNFEEERSALRRIEYEILMRQANKDKHLNSLAKSNNLSVEDLFKQHAKCKKENIIETLRRWAARKEFAEKGLGRK